MKPVDKAVLVVLLFHLLSTNHRKIIREYSLLVFVCLSNLPPSDRCFSDLS